jgi:hypothetical protein
MDDFSNETARWLEQRLDTGSAVELELGVLVAAASGWTEDEGEIDDLVSGLVETGRVALQIV